jgi:hypothetical protein
VPDVNLANRPVPRTQLRDALGNDPRLIKSFEGLQADSVNIAFAINTLTLQLLNSSPGAFNVRLFRHISDLHWDEMGLSTPDSIRTAGYSAIGKGAATYFRLPDGPWSANAYTIQDASGNWWRLPLDQPVEAEQLGAVGDAVIETGLAQGTDDTQAWQLALSGPWASVRANPVGYLVGDLRPAPGVTIFAGAGLAYTDNTNPFNPRVAPTFIRLAGAQSVFDMGWLRGTNPADLATYNLPIPLRSVTMVGIDVDGVARDCFGISGGSNRLRLLNVQVMNCSVDLGGQTLGSDGHVGSAYTRSARVIDCAFTSADIGAQNFIDSQFLGGEIANCDTFGWHCTNGGNSNTVIGTRIEFTQSGTNIEINNCSDIIFAAFLSDRGGLLGISIKNCTDVQINGVKVRRAGALGNVGFQSDAAIYLEDSQRIDLVNVTASIGHADGGTPPDTPDIGIVINNSGGPNPCSDISITGGDFAAMPTPLKAVPGRDSITRLRILNVRGIPDYDNSSPEKRKDGRTYYDNPVTALLNAAGGSQAFTMDLLPLSAFTYDAFTLTVWTRWDTGLGNRGLAKFALLSRIDSAGTAAVDVGSVFGEHGAAGAIAFGGGTAIDLAISAVAADASSFTLTITNVDATHKIEVYARVTSA